VHVSDLSPSLRQAIRLAREGGLRESATELEERSFAAYPTSSEWLGEVGEAILQFQSHEGTRVPKRPRAARRMPGGDRQKYRKESAWVPTSRCSCTEA